MKTLHLKLLNSNILQEPIDLPIRIEYSLISNDKTIKNIKLNWNKVEKVSEYYLTNNLFNEIQNLFIQKESILEFTNYAGVSYWQFLPSYIWPDFYKITSLISILKEVIEKNCPDEIIFYNVKGSSHHIWKESIKSLGRSFHISFKEINHIFNIVDKLLDKARFIKFYLKQFFKTDLFLINIDNPKQNNKSKEKKAIFLTLGSRHWVPIKEVENGENEEYYDEQFYPLIPELKKIGFSKFICIDCQDIPTIELSKRNTDEIFWINFSDFRPELVNSNKVTRIFKNKFKLLCESTKFNKKFTFLKIPIFTISKRVLFNGFLKLIPLCVEYFEKSKTLIKSEKPDLIIATYETGPIQRAALIAAKHARIPTISLQHGMIFDNHYDYMHENLQIETKINPNSFAIANVMCVWGDFWRSILIKNGHFPQKAVEVTGNWRLDYLFNEKLQDLSINYNNSQKIKVLILTAVQNSAIFLNKTIESLNKIGSFCIFVKPHPSENFKELKKITLQNGLLEENFKTIDTYKLILQSDFVISQPSTIVGEAAYLNKPILLVDLNSQREFTKDYYERGICLLATLPEEIEIKIKDLIYNPMIKESLALARESFIKDFYFKRDNLSSARVAEIADKLIKEY